jgi:tyrosyl-DNA phosphodiesterase 2
MAYWFSAFGRPRFEPAPAPTRDPEEKVVPFIPPEFEGDDNDIRVDEANNKSNHDDSNDEFQQKLPQRRPYRPSNVPFIPPDFEGSNDVTQSTNDSSNGDNVVISQSMQTMLLKLKPYRFRPSKNAWKHIVTFGLRNDIPPEEKRPPCSQVRIITWNIDCVTKHPEERLTACLRHIREEVLECKAGEAPEPCCILLQEVLDTVMPHLLRDTWVRQWFTVTPHSSIKWPKGARYGNVTLVSRSLTIAECHILHYGFTKMERTSLCVKIRLNYPAPSRETAIICVVNTHLESLPQGAVWRPHQLDMCSRFLRLRGVTGGVVAGDMNTIMPEDEGIEKEVGLRDAWRKGSAETGKTWGYQGQNDSGYPCGRLDKVLYLPVRGYKVDEPQRIGVGVKTRGSSSSEEMWASDHYGLESTLRMMKRPPDLSD